MTQVLTGGSPVSVTGFTIKLQRRTTLPYAAANSVVQSCWSRLVKLVQSSSGADNDNVSRRKAPMNIAPTFIFAAAKGSLRRTRSSSISKNMKNDTCLESYYSLIFFFPAVFFFFSTISTPAAAAPPSSPPVSVSSDFIRPGPRPIVFTPHNRSQNEPQQVHVSLAGKDYVRVSWVTEENNSTSLVGRRRSSSSTVDYGTEPGKYKWTAKGNSSKYTYFLYTSGNIHHTKIGPLQPSTTYYYQCGGFGPEFSFRTPPSTFPVEFVVVGDLGQTEWTKTTLSHINQSDYDIFLLPGDLSYADTNQPRWDTFGRLIEPYATQRPIMVTQGNHEIESIPIIQPEPFIAYNARWLMPYKESGSTSNLYYSFDVAAGVHVIMLGSYAEYGEDSEQYKWLKNDLASIDREKTPWVIVLLHAPWYNTNNAHQGEGEEMRKSMENLLYQGRVDFVFAGHVHAYERFTRVYNNKPDPCGPVYITIGDGGNREGLAMSFSSSQSSISKFREPSFGHGRLSIVDGTKAQWAWHRNNESNAVVADQVSIHSLTSSKACMLSSNDDQLQGKDEL